MSDGGQHAREFTHRNMPLSMLDVDIGTTVIRVERCYRCERETPHQSTYAGRNTWESYCLAHSETMRRKQWETATEPHRSWSR